MTLYRYGRRCAKYKQHEWLSSGAVVDRQEELSSEFLLPKHGPTDPLYFDEHKAVVGPEQCVGPCLDGQILEHKVARENVDGQVLGISRNMRSREVCPMRGAEDPSEKSASWKVVQCACDTQP